jgi:hypothetical protein
MNDQFDELTKGLAQSVTRRSALKKFGIGVTGMALATLGLAKAHAQRAVQGGLTGQRPPHIHCSCKQPNYGCDLQSPDSTICLQTCAIKCGS